MTIDRRVTLDRRLDLDLRVALDRRLALDRRVALDLRVGQQRMPCSSVGSASRPSSAVVWTFLCLRSPPGGVFLKGGVTVVIFDLALTTEMLKQPPVELGQSCQTR